MVVFMSPVQGYSRWRLLSEAMVMVYDGLRLQVAREVDVVTVVLRINEMSRTSGLRRWVLLDEKRIVIVGRRRKYKMVLASSKTIIGEDTAVSDGLLFCFDHAM